MWKMKEQRKCWLNAGMLDFNEEMCLRKAVCSDISLSQLIFLIDFYDPTEDVSPHKDSGPKM